ncbi:MAG: AbrB/MazE/SpoVT family DNA-binding domain-containing protein [Bacilli bacterium]|nr:AbrB/MazE/SpoVT family DNA-binding domain-containing protein [Bacilli bacterium]
MKATGVVRRIDELGRIVIPKEIRKTLRIKEGENLEIYIDNEAIILKKYSSIHSLDEFAQKLTDTISSLLKKTVIITDSDTIVAVSGELKKKYLGQKISNELESIIKKRSQILEKGIESIRISEIAETGSYTYAPIIANGDALGIVLILSKTEPLSESEEQIVKIVANFLAKHLEQ